jgi:hypothetical protein
VVPNVGVLLAGNVVVRQVGDAVQIDALACLACLAEWVAGDDGWNV